MRFDEKARENLEAAERLLPDDEGTFEALSNAAASRAYYAAYLAIADSAQRRHRTFTSDASSYYRHDRLPEDALRWGILGPDQCDDLRLLYGLRIKADYHEDQIELDEASQAFDLARDLVARALKDSPP